MRNWGSTRVESVKQLIIINHSLRAQDAGTTRSQGVLSVATLSLVIWIFAFFPPSIQIPFLAKLFNSLQATCCHLLWWLCAWQWCSSLNGAESWDIWSVSIKPQRSENCLHSLLLSWPSNHIDNEVKQRWTGTKMPYDPLPRVSQGKFRSKNLHL